MKITDLLKKESIELHGQVKTKEEAIDRMVELMVRSGNIRDENAYKQGVLKPEVESPFPMPRTAVWRRLV